MLWIELLTRCLVLTQRSQTLTCSELQTPAISWRLLLLRIKTGICKMEVRRVVSLINTTYSLPTCSPAPADKVCEIHLG